MAQIRLRLESVKLKFSSLDINPGDLYKYTWKKPKGVLYFLVIGVSPKKLAGVQVGNTSGLSTIFEFKLEDLAPDDKLELIEKWSVNECDDEGTLDP